MKVLNRREKGGIHNHLKMTGWNSKIFKGWLKRDEADRNSSCCTCCRITLKNASKSVLVAHKNTKKHNSNFVVVKSTMNISQFVSKKKSFDFERIANAEMLFTGYFSEHHIPFSNVEHLFGICKRAFPDSDIAKNVCCKRTKFSYTIQDGIANYEKLELNEICRTQKFSVIIDESTDASITQVLAIVIQYFDLKKLDVNDALLDTIVVKIVVQ